jgi:curved DNA-binding protein CbpA
VPGDRPQPEEDVDIDADMRRYVLDVSGRLDAIDHYQLLEVPRDADPRALKRAYFRLAGLLHPDRFFGKRLGSYKGPLLTIFARVTLAYETLASRTRRAEYDATLGSPRARGLVASPPPRAAAPSPPSPAAPPGPAPRVVDRRQEAMEALKQRFVEGKARARQHGDAAARARAAGDFVKAAEEYRAALRYVPDDQALKAAHAEVQRLAGERLAESRRRQAQLEERYGHWVEAAESWRRVTELCPGDEEARQRLAGALERSRRSGG